jgi:hypothetical protein
MLVTNIDNYHRTTATPDADIGTPPSKAGTLVIVTPEDLTIMRETRRLVGLSTRGHHEDEMPGPSFNKIPA